MKTEDDISHFLASQYVGVLSTVTPGGYPDAAPVYYLHDDQMRFFFITKKKTQKMANIAYQQEVCFTVTSVSKNTTVQIKGLVHQRTNWEEQLEVLLEKISHIDPEHDIQGMLPILKHDCGDTIMMELDPTYIRARIYSDNSLEEVVLDDL